MTVRRHLSLLLLLAGCGGDAAGIRYNWPEAASYRLDYVTQALQDTTRLVRYAESKTMRLVARDGRFAVYYDSVFKTAQDAGGITQAPYTALDTLASWISLSDRGNASGAEPICDPALESCARILPSAVVLEMRRVFPRLPAHGLEVGTTWSDTVSYDDASRPMGARGSVVTGYTVGRDTVIASVAYRVIGWRSSLRAWRPSSGARLSPEPEIVELGVTLFDPRLGLPAFSTWAGSVPAPPELRALGATSSSFRGRAWLAGTVFDSLYARDMLP